MVPSSQHSKAIKGTDPEQMREKIEGKQIESSWAKNVDTHASGVCVYVCVSLYIGPGGGSSFRLNKEQGRVEKSAGINAWNEPITGRLYIPAILWSDRPHDSRQTLNNSDTEQQRQKQIFFLHRQRQKRRLLQSLITAQVKRWDTPSSFDGCSFIFRTSSIARFHFRRQNYKLLITFLRKKEK